MSRDAPRSDKWAEWYQFHPNTLSIWAEVNGRDPKHEPFCEYDPAPTGETRIGAPCWCSAFCGYCDHHADRHTYGEQGPLVLTPWVPCQLCPGGLCRQVPST